MKIVLAGGSGYLGKSLVQHLNRDHSIIVLTRGKTCVKENVAMVHWDGRTSGPWVNELDGADVLINLTGKNVNCRYNEKNKAEIMRSRIDSVTALANAMKALKRPIPLWIQSSSATIYRHAEDKAMTEREGEIGTGFSVDVCKAWEKSFLDVKLAHTRKVILRTGIVFGKGDSAFARLRTLARFGLGGSMGNGEQRISWIHELDFVRAISWIMQTPSASGIYNCTAPFPEKNKRLMQMIADELHTPIRVPSPEWLLKVGAVMIGTETELILKSRWVIPERLQQEGFVFKFPHAAKAVANLIH
jgi:uncharacterized protein